MNSQSSQRAALPGPVSSLRQPPSHTAQARAGSPGDRIPFVAASGSFPFGPSASASSPSPADLVATLSRSTHCKKFELDRHISPTALSLKIPTVLPTHLLYGRNCLNN